MLLIMRKYRYNHEHDRWYDEKGDCPPVGAILVEFNEPGSHLDLADAYYQVGQHLQENGERLLSTAELLNNTADSICEENMRKKAP